MSKVHLVPSTKNFASGHPTPENTAIVRASREPAPMRLRILLSFHYYQDTDLDRLFGKYFTEPYPEVFLDSGGFSAATQGATIDLDAYCAYIQRFAHLLTTYANLDVIGDARATRRNQEQMERKGLSPIPVYHVGEDVAVLRDYIAGYPYIALGGMVPYMRQARKQLMPWLVRAFKLARADGEGHGPVRSVYHGFGCTSWTVVKALPWYSVDSSSWGTGFRYGLVPVFDPRAGVFQEIQLGDHATCYRYAPLVRALGFDPADFADRSRNDRAKICAISALSYLHAEQWLRRRHGEVRVPSRDAESPAGVGIHLSDTSNGINYRDAQAGMKQYLANTSATMVPQRDAAAGLKTFLADATYEIGDIRSVVKSGRTTTKLNRE